jgi:hypothetical protein
MITTPSVSSKTASAPYYIIGACSLILLSYFSFGLFRYYIDPDATSYLKIVENYVAGRYTEAINGFWSPMGCWLTVLWVKASHWPLFASAIAINTIAAVATLLASQKLFFKYRTAWLERLMFTLASALFWTYAIYKQSFTDIWQYFFILVGLLVLLKSDFHQKPLLWLGTGLIAALAYFSKAYSFYFFPLMTAAVLLLQLYHDRSFNWKKWLVMNVTIILTMLALASPWIFLLHDKYQIWTTSTAGKLNLSWWLVGHPEHRSDIKLLLPPPNQYAIFSFEDPYLIQGKFAHFWDSPTLMIKQLLRIGFNAIEWVKCSNLISPFYFITWILCIFSFFQAKNNRLLLSLGEQALAIVFLLYPCAFWLMSFDGGRYLWITIPLSMILGLTFAQRILWPLLTIKLRRLFIVIFFLSYLPNVIADSRSMIHVGKEEYQIAQQLKELGIKGSFATNKAIEGTIGHAILRIAYFSACPLYCFGENKWTTAEILKDAKRFNIDFYFYFYEKASEDCQLTDLEGNILPELTKGSIEGLKIYKLN